MLFNSAYKYPNIYMDIHICGCEIIQVAQNFLWHLRRWRQIFSLQILEYPILIMESKTQPNRVTMYGEVYNDNGLPVMAILELLPVEDRLVIDDMQKVNSAFDRSNVANYV
jgi:hypothetical protein